MKLIGLFLLMLLIVPLACADTDTDPWIGLYQNNPGDTLIPPVVLMFSNSLAGTINLSGSSPYEYEIENWTGHGFYNLLVTVTFPSPQLAVGYFCGNQPLLWNCETTPNTGVVSTITWFFWNTDGSLFNLPDLGNAFYLDLGGLFVGQFNGASATVQANVPEPASLFLVGTGLIALGTARRRFLKR